MQFKALANETLIASTAYVLAFLLTFSLWMPIQDMFFPMLQHNASLLFLPHGIRVLTAWLIGWRSIPALLPGVAATYYYLGGANILMPSRMISIAISLIAAPLVFYLIKKLVKDISPNPDQDSCWICVMGAGVIAAILGGTLSNLAFHSEAREYFAYFIGDVAGLFFLMMMLMLAFRYGRSLTEP